jgi:hypothetical protein
MTLNKWGDKWGVPYHAMIELSKVLANPYHMPSDQKEMSEDWVMSNVLLESSALGSRLWRNNVGATVTENGFLRYGICNETPAVNKVLKSSDFIGCTPIVIDWTHVGRTFGIYTAIETKKQGWNFKGTEREVGQLNYINLVKSIGGIAGFISDKNQFEGLIQCQI